MCVFTDKQWPFVVVVIHAVSFIIVNDLFLSYFCLDFLFIGVNLKANI